MQDAVNEPSETDLQLRLDSPAAIPHPEELNGTIKLALGSWASLTISGRATPAGLICVALAACAVLVPTLNRVARRRTR